MNTEQLRKELLKDIELKGETTNNRLNIIIAQPEHIEMHLRKSSGLPKISSNVVGNFNLLIEQPQYLSAFSPLEIRCCLCNTVIHYPCFYWIKEYSVNKVHFFVCFNKGKLDSSCYRRSK